MDREKSRVIETVKLVMPAVVSITISKDVKDLAKEMPEFFQSAPAGRPELNIPPDKINAQGQVQVGGGSGFIVDETGIVLTNKHVIAEANAKYMITTNSDETYDAEVLARDPINDVAILKINPKNKLPVLKMGDSEKLELGQTVLAIGNALGLFKNTVSAGIISGLSRAISAQADIGAPYQEMRGLIQTDAAINPGNSGGPLVDIFGQVIGINAAVVYGAQNINFAIPIKAAERDLSDLKKYGHIRRPLLGLRYLMVNRNIMEKLKLPVDYGAYITKENPLDQAVISKSPADEAGIKENDIVLEWNNQKITTEKSMQDYLDDCAVGDKVNLKILRDKKEFGLIVTLKERR